MPTIRSVTSLRVMLGFVDSTAQTLCGWDLMKSLSIGAGSAYPMLRALEKRGWVSCETEEPKDDGSPRRTLYQITEAGIAATRATMSLLRASA